MLSDIGAQLNGDQFRLWTLEVEGEPIASQLFAAAGGTLAPFVYGFDPAWADVRPGMQTLLRALEDAHGRGDRVLDFGPGAQHYKSRLATANRPLA